MSLTILPYENLPTETDLQVFETDIGYRLPDDYRQFLLIYNGGRFPQPENALEQGIALCFPGETIGPELAEIDYYAPGNLWDITPFYGLLRQPGDYGDIAELHTVRFKEMPPELMAIASQMGNSQYFLCLDGERRGQILFSSYETHRKYREDEPITQADFVCVAKSFSTLFQGLNWRLIPD